MKRCPVSFRIGSLLLFSWDFLHPSAVWVFCECENACFFFFPLAGLEPVEN